MSHHRWSFYRSGGVDQVIFKNGEDLARLSQLDQRLWMALSVPIDNIEFDRKTAELIDLDGDRHIRPPELIAAVDWLKERIQSLDIIMEEGDSLSLEEIADEELLRSAKLLLNAEGDNTSSISVADLRTRKENLTTALFNGDGVITVEAGESEKIKELIQAITTSVPGVFDKNGEAGVHRDSLEQFYRSAQEWMEWKQELVSDKDLLPMEFEKMQAALESVSRVKSKVDDFFTRCRLSAFDQRAETALNREPELYNKLAQENLSLTSEGIAELPLAKIAPNAPLPLEGVELNPAWAPLIAALQNDAIAPLLHSKKLLTEAEWNKLQDKLSHFHNWLERRPENTLHFDQASPNQIDLWMKPEFKAEIIQLIEKDEAFSEESDHLDQLEKLLLLRRDLYYLITNFVNFSQFYEKKRGLFQAGTLFLDARLCHLCMDVADVGKHATLAGSSACFLAYCDLTRGTEAKRSIVAVITHGETDNLFVGRNGVFYDHNGMDWDATITRIVSQPINVREAFWLPYKKLVRMIEEQIAKRAQAADESANAKLSDIANLTTTSLTSDAVTPPPSSPKKLDLGTIALIGTAIGGVSALVGGLLQALFGLGIWLPLGVIGILLLISGPSMLLAWLKLRQRNLSPILDANGWAINTKARLNIPFGTSLTELSSIPPGSTRQFKDPYAEKKQPWALYLLLLLLITAAILWQKGLLSFL